MEKIEVKLEVGFCEEDYFALKNCSASSGRTIVELVQDAVKDYMELWDDLEKYEEQKANGTLVTYTLEEVQERLGI